MAADLEWAVPGYTQVRELGAGASGRVVLATHDGSGTPVAIKYLSAQLLGDPEFVERFREEARLLAGLSDPNVVRYYGYVEDRRGAAIVMELVDGVSLRRILEHGQPLGPEAALVLLKGSLLGLAAAHAVGVVHRDYKPENILVAGDGASKLTDFGIAVRSGQTAPPEGTPAYMAPEQWTGAPAAPAADVYAATAVFYECLTGTRPYEGTLPELAEAHRRAPVPLDVVPEPLRLMIAHGMAKDPSGRPTSASALLSELHAVAVPVYGPEWERTGRRRLATLAGFLGALFPLVGLTELLPNTTVPPAPPTPPSQPPGQPPGPATDVVSGAQQPGQASATMTQPPAPPRPPKPRDGLLRPRILVPAVIAVVVLVIIGTVLVLFPSKEDDPEPGPEPTAAEPSLPGTPPSDPGEVITVVRRQMTAKKTAAFTYTSKACCGNELRVTGGRLSMPGNGSVAAARMVNPSGVPGRAMPTPARVVLAGDRAWVKRQGGWKSYSRKALADNKLASGRDPNVDYAKAALDVLSGTRLEDLALILQDARKAKLTRPSGAIQYRGKVRAGKKLAKRLGITGALNMPVVLNYRLRLGPDYLPRAVALKTTLSAGTPSASSFSYRVAYTNWGTSQPVRPPA